MSAKVPPSPRIRRSGSRPPAKKLSRSVDDTFRVIALISSFNEGDVIGRVIEHLVDNGVDVYLLDNRSTDDTVKQASAWLGRGLLHIETFPAPGDERYARAADRYDWMAILLRKEELARTLKADWFLHHDADEIRESPWEGVTLKDAIRYVDSLEYNCIDFRIFDFPPIDDGFRQGMDPKTYFTHWREAKEYDKAQLKCWKARPAVSITHWGGHDVEFEGKRPFPISFLLRHYPVRGQAHGLRKVFQERKLRFSPDERGKGWHIQYDDVRDEHHSFLVDAEQLKPFDLGRVRLEAMLRNRRALEQQRADAAALSALHEKLASAEQQLGLAASSNAHRENERGDHLREREEQARVIGRQLETVTSTLVARENEHQARIREIEARAADSETRGILVAEQLAEARSASVRREAEHQGELLRLERKVADAEQRREQLTKSFAEVSSRSGLLEALLTEANRREAALSAEIGAASVVRGELERRAADLDNARQVAIGQNAVLTAQVSELAGELADMTAMRDAQRAAASTREKQVVDLEAELLRLRDELDATRALCTAGEGRVAELEAKLLRVRDELGSSQVARTGLEQHLQSLDAELFRVRDELGRSQVARSGLEQHLRGLDADVLRLRDELGSTQAARRGLEQHLQTLDADLSRTRGELATVYNSRTWRWGEPVGRFLQSFGIMRNRREPPPPTSSAGDGAAVQAPSAPTARAHTSSFRILLVSHYFPTRAHAGGLRILDIYALIKENWPAAVIDLYSHHRPSIDGSIAEAYEIFDHIYMSPVEDLTSAGLPALGCTAHYDVVDVQFHPAGRHVRAFKNVGTKVIFTPMESMVRVFFIMLGSMFTRSKAYSRQRHREVLREALEERAYSLDADQAICVSRPDARYLRAVTLWGRVKAVETGLSKFEFAEALEEGRHIVPPERKPRRIVYVAYFGSHTNVHALLWYLDHVHPAVKSEVPDYVLTVVGRGDLSPFDAYRDDPSIEFVGEVPDISPSIDQAKVGIAPAVSGSGFRGKINQYAVFGVPSVVSPIAAHGLAYRNKRDIFIAASPQEFAKRCAQLLTDDALNAQIGTAARDLCLARYTWASRREQIQEIYNLPGIKVTRSPRVTALVPSFNHGRYLRQRIESIVNQTYKNVELIVIDDRSEDNSDEVITSLQAEHQFTYIRNARNSGTPFAAWGKVLSMATGEYIWVCESDDFAEPKFLETAVAALTAAQGSVLFYCNSHVVDDAGQRVDNTISYFHDIWKETRWDAAFAADGPQELVQFQLRGQIVPNMSSAVISTAAFRNAYRPFLKRLKLTGDWLFVGDVLAQGRVVYNPDSLSNFRRHEVTSRVRVKSARSQAEFILTKYLLFRDAGRPVKEFVPLMANDAIRFLYEPASFKEVLSALLRVSWLTTFKCAALLGMSVLLNREYPTKFFERYERVKGTS